VPQGATEYGLLVFRGDGVRKSETIGAQWLGFAARSGHGPAMQKLARLPAVGRGVQEDPVQAAMWYLLAKKRGLQDPWLDLFLKHLPAEKLRKARKLAEEFRPTRIKPFNPTAGGKSGLVRRPSVKAAAKNR